MNSTRSRPSPLPRLRSALLAACLLPLGTAAWCQAAPATPAAAPAAPAAPAVITGAAEPAVQTTVIEDQGAKVEELRVRGQVQRITVTPKIAGAKPYEVLPTDVGRDSMAGGTNAGRGIAGRSVWHMLSF